MAPPVNTSPWTVGVDAADWQALIAARAHVLALVPAKVSGALDAPPAPGQETSWLTSLAAEATSQLATIEGWLAEKTAAAKAKAKAALDAMTPMLERANAIAQTLVLLSPAGPAVVAAQSVATVTSKTADLVQAVGGVEGVSNVALLVAGVLALLWLRKA